MSGLYPTPRHTDLASEVGTATPLTVVADPTLPRQGYRLTITPDGTTLEHADPLGRRYGEDTLAQLGRAGLRAGVVEDWPDIADRGFMLDISRDRVPTMETLAWLVGVLGRLRFTELQLYTEHTFAWPDHEIVWCDSSPMTADEARSLAATCEAHGMRLVPCLNGFGHMERFLRHDRYRSRAECPDGAPAIVGEGNTPPTTLAPTDDNARFAIELFRGVLDAVPSDRIHIGGDEPFELGLGRSADAVADRGRAAVYAEHLQRLVRPLVADGHEVLFWGDVLSAHPDLAAALPAGTVPVAWWYDAPVADPPAMSDVLGAEVVERLGMLEDAMAGFRSHTRAFAGSDRPFWVAPGTSSWNSFIGRWPNARANIDDAVTVGRARGAAGLLLTDWGDHGHHQPLPVSLLPIAHAAGAAWHADTHESSSVPDVVDDLTQIDGLGEVLVALGSIDDALGIRQFNASALNAIVRGAYRPPRRPRIDAERVERALAALDDAIDRGEALASDPATRDGRAGVIGAELAATARLARHGVWRLAERHGLRTPTVDDLEADLARCIEQQRRAWLGSSRPGGLTDSLARLGGASDG